MSNKYLVSAELKKKLEGQKHIEFFYSADNYRLVWPAARAACSQGEKEVTLVDGSTFELKPSQYIVRGIAALEKEKAAAPLTVEQLLNAAEKENVPINQKVRGLINTLLGNKVA